MRIRALVSGKPLNLLLFSALAAGLALGSWYALPSRAAWTGTWGPWRSMLLAPDVPLEDALDLLESAGVSPVLSEVAQTVLLSDFVSVSRIPLGEALRRLMPDDPRRTPWLDRLMEYYRVSDGGETWRVVYFPRKYAAAASRALRSFRTIQSGAYGGVLERGLRIDGILLSLAPFGLAVFLIVRNRRSALFTAFSVIPWVSLWVSGEVSSALAGILGYLVLVALGGEDEFQPGRVFGRFTWNTAARTLPAGVGFLLCAAADTPGIPAVFLSVLSSACLILALENKYRGAENRRLHMVFRGSTLDVSRREKSLNRIRRQATFAAVCAAGLLVALNRILPSGEINPGAPGTGPEIPCRGEVLGSFQAAAGKIAGIVRERRETQLPDLADAVAHRAFQEALPFTRVGNLEYGSMESVFRDRVRAEGSSVLMTREPVLEFDESWAMEALREETSQGIGAVLGNRARVARVEKTAAFSSRQTSALASKGFLFYIMLLAPSGLGCIHGKRWIGAIRCSAVRSARKDDIHSFVPVRWHPSFRKKNTG